MQDTRHYSKDYPLPLERLFDTASARVMDHLLSNEGLRYTAGEISELAGVPERTLQRCMKILLGEGVVRRSKEGRTYHYEADTSSPRTKSLLKYMNATMLSNLDRALAEAGGAKRDR